MHISTLSRSGNALVVAMMGVTICSGLAMNMISHATSGVTMQSVRDQQDKAHFSASSVANWAAQWCVANPSSVPSFSTSNSSLTVPSALTSALASDTNKPNALSATLTMTGLKINSDLSRLYQVRSVVSVGSTSSSAYSQRTYDVLLTYTPAPPSTSSTASMFTRALFADLGYTVSGSSDTDAWDGSAGAYTSGRAIPSYGSALVGSNGTASTRGGGYSISSSPQTASNLGLTLPPYTWSAPTGALNASGGAADPAATTPWTGAITLYAGNTYYAPGGISGATITVNVPSSITTAASAVATIYLGGSFSANPIVFTGTNASWGKVLAYQKDFSATDSSENWNGNSSSGIQSDPGRFVFITEYGKANAAANITMNGTSAFGGVLYAPYCDFKLNGTFDFYGSLIMKSISQFNGNFNLHYDTRLAGTLLTLPSTSSAAPTVAILGWRES